MKTLCDSSNRAKASLSGTTQTAVARSLSKFRQRPTLVILDFDPAIAILRRLKKENPHLTIRQDFILANLSSELFKPYGSRGQLNEMIVGLAQSTNATDETMDYAICAIDGLARKLSDLITENGGYADGNFEYEYVTRRRGGGQVIFVRNDPETIRRFKHLANVEGGSTRS